MLVYVFLDVGIQKIALLDAMGWVSVLQEVHHMANSPT